LNTSTSNIEAHSISLRRLGSVLGMCLLTFSNAVFANATAVEVIENSVKANIWIKGEPDPSASIVERLEQSDVPGLSIAVVHNGKIDWAKGYGMAIGTTPVDANTLFQAGSISKPVAALAALKLVEQGKLKLDTDVNHYLEQWKLGGEPLTKDNPVTLRQLLTHTGGLTVHGFPGYATGDQLPTTSEVLSGDGNTNTVEVDVKPGSHWRYSGGGYTVMQKMVEDVTGLPFADYIDNQILKPIGMTNSTYQHELTERLKPRASAAYDGEGNRFPVIYNDYPEKAAAGLWTTPTDLAIYIMHMQSIMAGADNGILKKSTVEAMFSMHRENWGLGPALFEVDNQLAFEHGGKNLGFTNSFAAFVNKGEGIVVMSNGDNGGAVIPDIMTAISEYYDMGTHTRNAIDPIALDPDELNAYVGKYKMMSDIGFDGDFIIEMSVIDGVLMAKVPVVNQYEKELYRLVPTDKETFTNAVTGHSAVFSRNSAGEVSNLLVSDQYRLDKME